MFFIVVSVSEEAGVEGRPKGGCSGLRAPLASRRRSESDPDKGKWDTKSSL